MAAWPSAYDCEQHRGRVRGHVPARDVARGRASLSFYELRKQNTALANSRVIGKYDNTAPRFR